MTLSDEFNQNISININMKRSSNTSFHAVFYTVLPLIPFIHFLASTEIKTSNKNIAIKLARQSIKSHQNLSRKSTTHKEMT
mmetsp:Transcript_219/g.566  ORF Transcript_219/g.566 Transcript_219/m.566 type:complete len:81 (+) Transcript_219:167-409(+)